MKRHLYTLLLLSAVTAGLTACSTGGNLVRTRAHPQLAQRGVAVIGARLDTNLLGSLLFEYINLFRSQHNLPLFADDPSARAAAGWMARYQASIQSVTHESTIAGKRTVAERYASSGGPEYAFSGENAAWTGFFDEDLGRNLTYDEMARRILDNWINSPHHLQNLVLKGEVSKGGVGIGVAQGPYTGWDGVYSTMDAIFLWQDDATAGKPTARKLSPPSR